MNDDQTMLNHKLSFKRHKKKHVQLREKKVRIIKVLSKYTEYIISFSCLFFSHPPFSFHFLLSSSLFFSFTFFFFLYSFSFSLSLFLFYSLILYPCCSLLHLSLCSILVFSPFFFSLSLSLSQSRSLSLTFLLIFHFHKQDGNSHFEQYKWVTITFFFSFYKKKDIFIEPASLLSKDNGKSV